MCADKQFHPDVGSTKLFFRETDNGKLNSKSESDFKGFFCVKWTQRRKKKPLKIFIKTTQSPRFGSEADLMFLRQPITV